MNKVNLTPNEAVNIEKTLKSGFFAVTASLCGLLTGSAGCSVPTSVSTLTFAAGDEYPRLIEPQFLARLDSNRRAMPMPDPNDLAGGVIPTNAVPQVDLWDTALYYAVKETSQDFSFLPPVRDIIGSDFGALTYEVDDTTGTTIIKPTAYEAEPYTGRVILENNATQILVAYINRGRFAETGTLRNDTGELVLAENHYDELGYPTRAKEWDEDGQLIAQRPQVDPTQPTLPPGVQPLPIGAILVADSEVRGEFIYQRADDALLEKLNQQIEAATDPDESTRLQGELLQAQLAAATPFNGTVLEFWDKDRTKKKREEPVVIGKHEGTVIWWYENGQKEFEAEYLKGIPQGRTAWYREDGSLEYEGFWQDDNGTPKLQRASTWDATDAQSGQVIDGNGTLVYFHTNGQKRMEETFTNGLLSASLFWDDMGEPVESVDPSFIPPPPKLD